MAGLLGYRSLPPKAKNLVVVGGLTTFVFGAILDSTGSLAEFACEVEITEYHVAEVEWIQDI
ncbi:hypothetical protein glysoja_048032 [Glycine soja]|uniref:Uncharacterized protein n=1 Tax=Glycine soja TaxID=3848 RepID=A0A0B2SI19_GLYSO|nr:hypothetical protein glysoja_048032 [Glycine soja]